MKIMWLGTPLGSDNMKIMTTIELCSLMLLYRSTIMKVKILFKLY